MRRLYWLGLVALAGVSVGCSDSKPGPVPDAAVGGNGGAAGSAGQAGGAAGSNPDAGAAGAAGTLGNGGMGGSGGAPLLAAPAPIGLASINNDVTFQSTSVSILDPNGGLKHDDCVDSSAGSGATPAVSTDVVLPSQPQRGGALVIVDRKNGALTTVDPSACKVTRQVPVPSATGVSANPHDVAIVADDKAYVTRYSPNLTGTTPAELGNDVIVIDPTTGAFQSRINLDAYASTVAGATILARPDRLVIANGQVIVSLNEIDAGFATYGEGKLVVIDPATDTVTGSVALTGFTDCEGMDYIASSKTLLVACGGTYADQNQPLQSGIAVVDVSTAPPTVLRQISSVAFGDQPVNFAWVLDAPPAGGGTRAFAGTNDPNFVNPDALYAFDYVLGTTIQIATSDPFTIGPSAATASLLFVPEFLGTTPKIQLFSITGTPAATSGFAPDPARGLAPAQVGWY
ncbi:MAG TPA: hypothetical protein VHG72_07150 [Polyangia bacterium]|nr:hypothetical protein [Polyangia bacterium]